MLFAAVSTEISDPVNARILSFSEDLIEKLGDFDWIVFTSRNGVSLFWEQLLSSGLDARALAGLRAGLEEIGARRGSLYG